MSFVKEVSRDFDEVLNSISKALLTYDCKILDLVSDGESFHCDFESKNNISINEFDRITQLMHKESPNLPEFFLESVSGLHDSVYSQRISGKIFSNAQTKAEYIEHLENAAKMDHRYLGQKLELFILDRVNTPGMVTWLPNGVVVLELIKNYIRKLMRHEGYKEVITPILARKSLFEQSGHASMYHESMYFLDEDSCALKPMNCPEHTMIFKHHRFHYKDLPVKLSEFGMCTRKESPSALHGLIRVKGFTQDDAHVFCREDDIEGIILNFCHMLKKVYNRFGFEEITLYLSTRPEPFAGEISTWDKAEAALASAATKFGMEFKVNEGDGAFYGPKLDFHIKDNRGRIWQCGTVQLDFVLGKRLEANYTDESGQERNPVIIHHAVLGSIERFLGITIEHYKGHFPLWLAPIQVCVLSITEAVVDHCRSIVSELEAAGVRVALDTSNDTISYKIRRWWTDKMVPISIIIGKKEVESGMLAVRIDGADKGVMKLEDIINIVRGSSFE